MIHEVGRWALRKAIEDYLRWRAAGLAAVRIAVNVSPLQLRNRGFIAEIKRGIGIDAHAAAGLELEITESVIMEDVKHSIASLQAIRAMGVSIAIDDFGTGFSSLSYLSKLPVDTLKIDRSFVIDMTAGPEGLALVSTIINLAHSLKLKVVAEGVETEEQSRLLRLLSCDEMQGYLFSKPAAERDLRSKIPGALNQHAWRAHGGKAAPHTRPPPPGRGAQACSEICFRVKSRGRNLGWNTCYFVSSRSPQTCRVQFSILRSWTRPNSLVLLVTSVRSRARAWAAMKRSFAPIIAPRTLSAARIWA